MHYLVANDGRSQLQCTLIRNNTGNPVNLTELAIKLKIRSRNSSTTLTTLEGSIVTAEDGIVLFELGSFLENRSAGFYEGEIYTEDVEGKEIVYELVDFQVRANFS